jgi:hypothetical protein
VLMTRLCPCGRTWQPSSCTIPAPNYTQPSVESNTGLCA